ncbi:MAG TPA: helix-turn-helix domain-containing protein [Armatimonadota bacterium]|nr:helix-turn-helix domain-containing protein [Armatimonadota bacterium]
MAGRRAPREEILIEPLGVVSRQSTDVLAIEDGDVAEAVRFIRLKASSGIDVEDVLGAVPVSRRVLERRFRKCLGRTPKEEIMRVKLNRAKELLSQTDLSVGMIAQQTGFSSINYFANVFQREVKTSPRTYRNSFRLMGDRRSNGLEGQGFGAADEPGEARNPTMGGSPRISTNLHE